MFAGIGRTAQAVIKEMIGFLPVADMQNEGGLRNVQTVTLHSLSVLELSCGFWQHCNREFESDDLAEFKC